MRKSFSILFRRERRTEPLLSPWGLRLFRAFRKVKPTRYGPRLANDWVCHDCRSTVIGAPIVIWCSSHQGFGDGKRTLMVYCWSCAASRITKYQNLTGLDAHAYTLQPL